MTGSILNGYMHQKQVSIRSKKIQVSVLFFSGTVRPEKSKRNRPVSQWYSQRTNVLEVAGLIPASSHCRASLKNQS